MPEIFEICKAILCLICFFIALLAGFFAILPGMFISLIYHQNLSSQINGCVALLTIILFLHKGFKLFTLAFTSALAVFLDLVLFFAYPFVVNVNENLGSNLLIFFVTVFVVINQVLVQAVARIIVEDGRFIVFLALSGGIGGGSILVNSMPEDIGGVLSALILIQGINVLNCYLGWRAIKCDPRDELILRIALNFATIGSTNFYKANLTDADFTGAILKNIKNTNFHKTELIRNCKV